ncbi:CpaF/VirB11 family protein [Isoptericola sp. b490]|uniref:CpaF family protein n=1 Tax=Actinotalea lenta TaxID=3064654 RepID=UPI0027127A95|nr:CpaF/VirB11 family protein [Isoptericola sp. b490]MDO8119707.1 CpaF/VirB11 family protein [Isoptericola sp. b490]
MSTAEQVPNPLPTNDGKARPLHAVVEVDDEAPNPTVVNDVRHAVAEAMAVRLQAAPVAHDSDRRELARGLIAAELAERRRTLVRTGEPVWSRGQEQRTSAAVMAALFGVGRLQPLVDDPDVENIEVDGYDRVWLCYADGREVQHPPIADSDAELIEVLQLLAARNGGAERMFSPAHPILHLRLPDGSRLAAMAWTTRRPQLVIRRHRVHDVDLDDLVRLGTLDTVLAAFLRAAVRAGRNIVVTGLQNAGKTTLIRALANEFDLNERFATVEKEYELHLDDLPERHPRVVPMEAREGSAESDALGRRAGEITLSELVTSALRMNLRRIIVGEVRGAEVLPMLEAMSTGDGSLCTLHARSAQHGIDRIVTLCLSAGVHMSETFAYRLLAGSVDFVVHIELLDDKAGRHRFVSQVIEINGLGEGSRPTTTTVFGPGEDGRAVPLHHPDGLARLVRAGFDPSLLSHRAGTWSAWPLGNGDPR